MKKLCLLFKVFHSSYISIIFVSDQNMHLDYKVSVLICRFWGLIFDPPPLSPNITNKKYSDGFTLLPKSRLNHNLNIICCSDTGQYFFFLIIFVCARIDHFVKHLLFPVTHCNKLKFHLLQWHGAIIFIVCFFYFSI